jgi:hypothetical protein
MHPQDAYVLDNLFPYNTSVDLRAGSQNYATGIPAPVESLEVYTGGVGSKMLAFAGTNGFACIYDVSAAGVVGAPLLNGRTSSKMTSCMFSNAGSQWLMLFNGVDPPYAYNGALTALVITGVTGSQNTLHSPHTFKGRLYLAQEQMLGFYYLAPGAIQGAASYFDLQQQSENGGYLVSIASFSQESGQGPQDYIVFMTSEGEYIMYAGTDPSNAATWTLVGRYFGPPPIGRKGWFKFRSDLYIITVEGILSLSQMRQMGDDGEKDQYLTGKLGRLFSELTTYKGTHGWQGFIYPQGSALYINMPVTGSESGGYVQYVMNTNSNAWCRYTGLNGICWALFNRDAYFGTFDGRIVLNGVGTNDNGADIVAECRQAWNNFDDGKGSGDMDKQIHFATFIMQADGTLPVSCSINMNYEDDQPDPAGSLAATNGGVWDIATWDVDAWAGVGVTQNLTVPVGKIGYTASLWLNISTQGTPVRWYATRIIMEMTEGIVLI